jgi:hypothetical protein
MFRALTCSSSGVQIVLSQHLVSSFSVNGCTICQMRADCCCCCSNLPSSGVLYNLYRELIFLSSQSEKTLLCIREQSLYRGASQWAVRRLWLSWCTVWPSHPQWPSEQISFSKTMCLPNLRSISFYSAKHLFTPVCQNPYSTDFAVSCGFPRS